MLKFPHPYLILPYIYPTPSADPSRKTKNRGSLEEIKASIFQNPLVLASPIKPIMENIGEEYRHYWETNMFLQTEELDRYFIHFPHSN